MFFLGALLGFGFNGLAIFADLNGASFWGDIQDAVKFNHNKPTQAELVKIRCPILLAPGEEGLVTAAFQNPNQKRTDISVKVVVSKHDFDEYRVVTSNLPLEPGDEQEFRWQVTGQDIIERNFILTRVFLINQEGSEIYPARTDACGIFVWSLFGLRGGAVVVLTFIASLISLLVGSVLLYISDSAIQNSSPRLDYGLYGIAGILLLGMIANLLAWWNLALIFLVVAVILTVVILSHMLFIRVE